MIHTPDSTLSKDIKCTICKALIEDRDDLYQTSMGVGVICDKCKSRFSDEDIEMIVNLFVAYGGFFGMYDKKNLSVSSLISDFGNKISSGKESFQTFNIKMWHKVLTHGITPSEFIQELNLFVNSI